MYLHISTIDGKDLIENSLLMYSNQVLMKYFVDIFFKETPKKMLHYSENLTLIW